MLRVLCLSYAPPEIEFTKVILSEVSDFWQLAIHCRGFFSDLRFPIVP